MAIKSRVVEKSFRMGCGRYIQENNAIAFLGSEIKKLGCSSPFIMGGKTAFGVAKNKITDSLNNSNLSGEFYEYIGFCNPQHCDEIVEKVKANAYDVIVGVGGGNIMDAAKLCAAKANLPIINIPTQSATCAAHTPLSVMYNNDCTTLGSKHHEKEVNVVLADMEILSKQPTRTLVSGAFDALAKYVEIFQRLKGKEADEIDIGLATAYSLSKYIYDKLLEILPKAYIDLKNGINSKAVYDTVYITILTTGVISSFSRGSNQCAIAHKVYESTRTLFPKKSLNFLHGEMVGLGMLPQLVFNGKKTEAEEFKKQMIKYGLPVKISDLGIEPTEENLKLYFDAIMNSSAMAGANEEDVLAFGEALKILV